MAGLIVAAPHLILGLYGTRWEGAVLPLQILATAGVARALLGLGGSVTRACDRVPSEVPLQVGFAIAVTAGTVLGSRYGLTGVALCVSAAIVLMSLAQARLALSITGATWRSYAAAHVQGLVVAVLVLLVAMPVRILGQRAGLAHVPVLLLLVASGAASVSAGVYLLPSRIRPYTLFAHLSQLTEQLPAAVRVPLLHVLGGAT